MVGTHWESYRTVVGVLYLAFKSTVWYGTVKGVL